jgi:hypothetical protein
MYSDIPIHNNLDEQFSPTKKSNLFRLVQYFKLFAHFLCSNSLKETVSRDFPTLGLYVNPLPLGPRLTSLNIFEFAEILAIRL